MLCGASPSFVKHPYANPATTFYKRELPANCVSFAGKEGRQLFSEALAAGTLECYFALAEQFRTQSEPAYCGLGSLVMALNTLGTDPQRVWKVSETCCDSDCFVARKVFSLESCFGVLT